MIHEKGPSLSELIVAQDKYYFKINTINNNYVKILFSPEVVKNIFRLVLFLKSEINNLFWMKF